MCRGKLNFTIVFFLLTASLFGQKDKKIDSLNILLSQSTDNKTKGEIENQITKHLISFRALEKAKEHASQALNYGIACDSKEIVSEAFLNFGNIAHIKAEDSKAIDFYQKVDSILTKEEIFNSVLYKAYYNTANLHYIKVHDDTVGLKRVETYLKKAQKVANIIKDSVIIAQIGIRIGDIYRSKKDYKEALSQFRKAEKSIPEGNKKLTSNLLWAYGDIYLLMGQINKASKYFDKRFNLLKNAENPNEKAGAYWVHSNFLFESKQYQKAIPILKKSLDLYEKFEENKDLPRLGGTSSRISRAYEALGDNAMALYYFKKAIEYNDKHRDLAKEDLIEELETKYETEKKEQEIVLLKSQNELAEQRQRSQRNLLLGGIGFTSLAGLFLFVLYQNRQKTNKKLRELDAVKSNFFANISHEFRTPLTLISAPLQNKLEEPNLNDKDRAELQMMLNNSERLNNLVDQLLDLSKIESGSLQLQIQQGNPLKQIAGLAANFEHAAQQKEITFSTNINKDEVAGWFDSDALNKIVTNLLSNAIKFTPENGSVICNAFMNGAKLHLTVKNSGEGLTAEQQKKVFDRFYQTSKNQIGTGIGLALVKELVTLYKGTITLESTPNEWTSFSVVLPTSMSALGQTSVMEADASEKYRSTGTAKVAEKSTKAQSIDLENEQPIVLIVEDNLDLRQLLKSNFEADYQVLLAKDGAEGVALAIEHIPEIIISDVMMPKKDGMMLTQELKQDERTSHIPIILLTAKASEKSQLEGLEFKADDYITKPFNQNILAARVNNLIETRKTLQQRYSQEVVLRPKDIAITPPDQRFLEKVQDVLDHSLVESDFSVEEFSKAVGMSRMQLHRKLKALTGLSATEFVRSQRLKLAAQLLKKSEISVSQVGYSVGFNDHSYFTKCFKKLYKCTPSEYAKKS